MNSLFGHFSESNDSTYQNPPVNWGFPQFRQYILRTSVPKPAKTWLVLDEHPDSINDGYFINNPSAINWQDVPSSLHNGACGISFADGHVEMRRWLSPTSIYPVRYFYSPPRVFDGLGRADYAWYLEHSGYVYASTGQAAFGY